MMDEYSIIKRQISPAVITGKPLTMGGSSGRDTATAMGAFSVIGALMPKVNRSPESTTVAIQGFGNAGSILAELLFNGGYKIVAVSDSKGAIYAKNGLDIPSIKHFKESTRHLKAVYCEGTVCNIVEHDVISNEELLTLDVDMLIPAALENQITAANADDVKAKLIFEVANGPTAAAADEILERKGTLVVPDILTNAGGVTVSYFEWVQNRMGLYWKLDEVNARLKERILEETERIWAIAEEKSSSMRTAAYVHALNRIGEAVASKGTKDYYTGAG
jgi:glutamate dehydrogenase (NADP+)